MMISKQKIGRKRSFSRVLPLFSLFCFGVSTPAIADKPELVTTLKVTERSGVNRPEGLVETGVPLPRGLIKRIDRLVVSEGKKVLPARIQPLAYWGDGSIRWMMLDLPLSVGAGRERSLNLWKKKGAKVQNPPLRLPRCSLVVRTRDKVFRHRVIRSVTGVRSGSVGFDVDCKALTKNRSRLRFQASQVDGDECWQSVSIELPSAGKVQFDGDSGVLRVGPWTLAVRNARQRGPVTLERVEGNRLLLHLHRESSPGYPADEGFQVSHELLIEYASTRTLQQVGQCLARPLRATLDPDYVRSTRALGDLGPSNDSTSPFDTSMAISFQRFMNKGDKPKNLGWVVYGDRLGTAKNFAYMGYLNQEYDPATTLFLYALRTGDLEALDQALDMAVQYADQSVSPQGGNYQHRSTLFAILDQFSDPIAVQLRSRWRSRPGQPATEDEILKTLRKLGGSSMVPVVEEIFGELSEKDPFRREEIASRRIAFQIANRSYSRLVKRSSTKKDPTPRKLVQGILQTAPVTHFRLPGVDSLFEPFFHRYGGSWRAFPDFVSYHFDDDAVAHTGGHSLVGMLVMGYLQSGDPALKRSALRVAEYHLDHLVDRSFKTLRRQLDARRSGQPSSRLFSRLLGWPLINLVSARTLTEGSDPRLHARIDAAIGRIVTFFATLEPDDHEGTIHVGVVCEGLARLHRETGNPQALEVLLKLTREWCKTQWNEKGEAFNRKRSREGDAQIGTSALMLHGLAYAAAHDPSDDDLIARRAKTILQGIVQGSTGSSKPFAMTFRSSQRALAYLVEDPRSSCRERGPRKIGSAPRSSGQEKTSNSDSSTYAWLLPCDCDHESRDVGSVPCGRSVSER